MKKSIFKTVVIAQPDQVDVGYQTNKNFDKIAPEEKLGILMVAHVHLLATIKERVEELFSDYSEEEAERQMDEAMKIVRNYASPTTCH